MRGLRLLLVATLFVTVWVVPALAAAQADDFDDTFEDGLDAAFDTAPAPQQPPPAGDAGFDDAFGAEPVPQQGVPAAAAVPPGPSLAPEIDPSADFAPSDSLRLLRVHSAVSGPTGGIRTVDAGSGLVDVLRAQLAFEFFKSNGFLVDDGGNQFIAGTLALNFTPADFLEVYLSIASHANANAKEEPGLFQVLGDSAWGVKAFHPVLPWLTLGGDARLVFLNTVGDIGVVLRGTSFGLRGNATADFRRLPSGLPLIGRFNLGYYFDNSAKLVEEREQERFQRYQARGETTYADPRFEDVHLLTRVERFALGINRTDRLNLTLGFEAPLEVSRGFFLHPILEWHWGIPVNRQGYSCLISYEAGADKCLKGSGLSSFPMTATFGLRALPPVRGLGLVFAIEGGLTGASKAKIVRELAPNRPYTILFAASYAYDTRAPVPIIRKVEVGPEPPKKARVNGSVIEKGAEIGVAGATVRYLERELTPQQTFENGQFVSYEFEKGEVRMQISHPDYEDGACAALIEDPSKDVEIRCELVAKPRVASVDARVVDGNGKPVPGASVEISGPAQRALKSGPAGGFKLVELPPGQYTARVEAKGFMIKLEKFTLVARQTATPVITLAPKPKRILVKVTDKRITIRRKIHFVTASHEIREKSTPLMKQIADVMLRHRELELVEIQGHTDNIGAKDYNQGLSQRRADSVREWLITAGVDPKRMVSKGFGSTRPLAPNITASNRARNRRVQFVIRKRAKTVTKIEEEP